MSEASRFGKRGDTGAGERSPREGDPSGRGSRRTGGRAGGPLSHRLLLRAYPRWFSDEFASDLMAHLAMQHTEARYCGRPFGGARFWWDAAPDALRTGMTLRLERARERFSRLGPGVEGMRPARWRVVTRDPVDRGR